MRIIKIQALENGGHCNQTGNFKTIPDGWAVIPDDMETPNFPFGKVTTKETDGVMTVTEWVACEMPAPTPNPVSETEQLRADIDYIAVMTGVEL